MRREVAEVAKAAERSGVPKPADATEGGEAKCSGLESILHCSTFAKRSGALGVCKMLGNPRNGAKQGGEFGNHFRSCTKKVLDILPPLYLTGVEWTFWG